MVFHQLSYVCRVRLSDVLLPMNDVVVCLSGEVEGEWKEELKEEEELQEEDGGRGKDGD